MMSQNPINKFPSIDGLIARYSARGLTNEQLSQNPILKDLSGNGHDITLHNFAWSGASGYGGYSQNFDRWGYGNLITMTQTHTSDKIELNVTDANENIYSHAYDVASVGDEFNFSIKVTGLQDPCTIRVTKGVNSGDILTITQDGTYDINATIEDSWDQYRIYFFINNRNGSPFDLTIEQVPLYPNALVSDGVDDYGICKNFPILTKENGYTVVAVRNWLDINTTSFLLTNRGETNVHGAFKFEGTHEGNINLYSSSFSQNSSYIDNSLATKEYLNDSSFSYQRSTDYNGYQLTIGEETQGTNRINLFCEIGPSRFAKVALYDLLIYDRDLTEDEINKLRDYFYQRDNEPLDSSLVDAWIFSGYKNEDAPDAIAGVKGTELTCYNFAWNEEGSGFKDGALWFDGVDDYLIGRNKFPILTDYTIIMKRNIFELGGYATVACKWIADEIKGNGAFLFEFNGTPNNHIPKPNKTFSFSNSNEVGDNSISSDQIPELISWQTKNRYNGHEINSGIQSDGRNFTIGRKMLYGAFCKISVNYCALYDKSLTESEIQSEIKKLETLWKNRLNNQ